jgi:hypothetical protein
VKFYAIDLLEHTLTRLTFFAIRPNACPVSPSPCRRTSQTQLVLQMLTVLQRISIIAIVLVSGVAPVAWLLPSVGRFLPTGWDQIEANSALCAILSALSLAFSNPRRSRRSALISPTLALFVFLIAGITVVEYLVHSSTWVDTFLVSGAGHLPADPLLRPHAPFSSLALLWSSSGSVRASR